MTYDPASARALLTRTPAVLGTLLRGLPVEWLDASERPGAWSPRQVACHLADLERDAWLPRARWILEHGSARALPAVDPERFRGRYADAPLETVLDDFRRAREANLEELDRLDPDEAALATTGLHHVLGDVRLAQLLSAWVIHDLNHLAQVTRALASRYREAVGPWVEFLPILRARSAGT